MAVIENTQLRGTLLAIEEINAAGGINGRELVPLIYDPASESAAFGRYARGLGRPVAPCPPRRPLRRLSR